MNHFVSAIVIALFFSMWTNNPYAQRNPWTRCFNEQKDRTIDCQIDHEAQEQRMGNQEATAIPFSEVIGGLSCIASDKWFQGDIGDGNGTIVLGNLVVIDGDVRGVRINCFSATKIVYSTRPIFNNDVLLIKVHTGYG